MNHWDLRFIKLAKHISSWSKDKSTKVGAVIVNDKNNPISMGFNGFPSKIDETIDERHAGLLKYEYTVHGEANAIANAAKNGQKTEGCTMYVTYFPCSTCAGLIVNSGIKKIVCENEPDLNHEKWGEKWKISKIILKEGGVKVNYMNYDAHRQGKI